MFVHTFVCMNAVVYPTALCASVQATFMLRLPPLGLAVFHLYNSPDSPLTLRSDTLLRLSGRGLAARAVDPLPVRSQQSDPQTFYISSQSLTLGFSGTTGLLEVGVVLFVNSTNSGGHVVTFMRTAFTNISHKVWTNLEEIWCVWNKVITFLWSGSVLKHERTVTQKLLDGWLWKNCHILVLHQWADIYNLGKIKLIWFSFKHGSNT